MGVIFPIVFYFLNTTTLPNPVTLTAAPDSEKVIYLVKIRWHTGIIFRTDQADKTKWKFIDDFKGYKYVDVGWGDKDFYQHPGFDIDLAVKALFFKTQSTLRISGFNRGIDKYLETTDYAEKLILNDEEYGRLCSYIQSTYSPDDGYPVILSEHFGGAVKFYRAKGYYTVFNTCNTWIAKALNYAGYKIDGNIILVEQLFRETVKYGTMVKVPGQ
jgi:uncharacterized protein (TIGR02117 family)